MRYDPDSLVKYDSVAELEPGVARSNVEDEMLRDVIERWRECIS